MPIELNKQPEKTSPTIAFKPRLQAMVRRRIGDKERRFFTEQMALLLETGSNLHASLKSVKDQIDNPAMLELVEQLIQDIGEGKQFSHALARHPQVFSQTYVNLIAASEDGGFMHEVLEQLLDMEEKRAQLQQTLFSALSYPVFLLLFALGVVIFVLVVVFPKFEEMFSMISDQLPTTTVWLMATSELFRQQWPSLLGGMGGLYLVFRTWASRPQGRYRIDWAKLNLPVLRSVFIQLYLLQMLRVLSLSLGNGVGILDSLHACRDVVRNQLYRRFIDEIETRVERGDGIAAGFTQAGFIPPVVGQMISTGEETGNLPKVMARLADFYERELSNRLKTLSKLAEPVMLLVMGVVVGLLVSSLILPIFKLSRAVG